MEHLGTQGYRHSVSAFTKRNRHSFIQVRATIHVHTDEWWRFTERLTNTKPPTPFNMCLCACTLSYPSHQSTTVSNMPCEQGFWQIRLNLWHTFNLQDREDLGREGYFWHMVNAQDCQRHTLSSIIRGTIGGEGSTGRIWFQFNRLHINCLHFF